MKEIFFIVLIFISNIILSQEIDTSIHIQKEICSCQSNPNKVYSTNDYVYYETGNLKQIFTTINKVESDTNISDYFYNKNGFLSRIESKTFVGVSGYDDISERTKIFEYNTNNQLIYSGLANTKNNNLETKYKYFSNGKLESKIITCNSNISEYSYKYDKNDKLIKEFKDGKLKVKYKYNDQGTVDTKIEYRGFSFFRKLAHSFKRNHTKLKTITTFEYDNQYRLIKKIRDEKVIEKRVNDNEKLIEKWTNYYGCDPCMTPCCSANIYKYEY